MMRIRGMGAALVAAVVLVLVAGGFGASPTSADEGEVAGTQAPQSGVESARAALTGSVLGYQCGAGVCLVDPDVPRAQPVVVVPDGRFAGVSADGKKVAWVQPGGDLVTAPSSGGAPTTVYTGAVGNQPLMSPDGARFLWQSPVCIDIGFSCFYYTYRLDVATGEVTGVGACACTSTHGFIGPTSIGAFPGGSAEPSEICIIGTEAETGPSSCGPVQVSEPRGVLSFPDGSSDGQLLVAAMDPAGSEFGGFQGRIALYSRATGALVKDLTTNDTDTTPTLSAEGDRVAFERGDQIMVIDVNTGAERTIGPGVYPSWGGLRSEPGNPGNPGAPGAASAAIKGTRLTVKAGAVKVRVACSGTGSCAGTATLAKGRKALAKKSYAVPADRTSAVKLRLTKAGKKALRGNGRLRLKLTLRASGGGAVTKMVAVRF